MPLLIEARSNAEDVRKAISDLPRQFDVALFRATEEGLKAFQDAGVQFMGRQPEHARAAIHMETKPAAEGYSALGTAFTDGSVDDDGKIAWWRQFGTGLFGPRQQRITPTTKKALAFTYKGQSVVVRSVAGAPGNAWFDQAYQAARPAIEKGYSSRIEQVVASPGNGVE